MKCVFNHLMIMGVIFGGLIYCGILSINDAAYHHGSGYVSYEDDVKEVSENQYKRHHYANGFMLLAIGVFLWVLMAKIERNEAAKAKAETDSLRALRDWYIAYRHAFEAALDDVTRDRASAAARLSVEVKEADTTLKRLQDIEFRARWAAESNQ